MSKRRKNTKKKGLTKAKPRNQLKNLKNNLNFEKNQRQIRLKALRYIMECFAKIFSQKKAY